MPRKKDWSNNRDIILFVASIPIVAIEAIRELSEKEGKQYKIALVFNSKRMKSVQSAKDSGADILIPCDFSKENYIIKALKPYEDRLLAVTCRSERNMGFFKSISPFVPYLRTPTESSISWSTDKLEMRRRLKAYDSKITPKHTLVSDSGQESIDKIKKKIGFPLIVKPAGLAQSMLVSVCYHEEELATCLRKTTRAVRKKYKDRGYKDTPKILVEELLEGDQYSIDGYVGTRGAMYFCPPVSIKTGQMIGFDDFFGYQQMTPTNLTKPSIKALEKTTEQGVKALGLRNSTFHAELIRTEKGWKIIEIGARIGGFRHDLYQLSYGINHSINDFFIRIPQKPIVTKRNKGYSAAMKFYSKTEGILQKVKGLKKIKEFDSLHSVKINKEPGDRCRFAKNGGSSVLNLILHNKNRSDLLGDIRRIEKTIVIEVTKK